MASGAIGAKQTFVNIVTPVARDAGGRLFNLFGYRRAVTLGTCLPGMRTGEAKIGLCVMIENPKRPAIRIVTGFAVRSQCRLVLVVGQMAGNAVGFPRRKGQVGMTRFARHDCVLSYQWEIRELVIEQDVGDPVFG